MVNSNEVKGVFKDKRIDSLIGWVLNFAAVIALSAGAYFFNALVTEMRTSRDAMTLKIDRVTDTFSEQIGELSKGINSLNTSVEVLKVTVANFAELRDEIKNLEIRLRAMENSKNP